VFDNQFFVQKEECFRQRKIQGFIIFFITHALYIRLKYFESVFVTLLNSTSAL